MSNIERFDVGPRLSEMAIHNGVVYLAGQVPEDATADVKGLAGMNAAWDAWVPAGHTPPRATVEAKLAKPEWKIEIVITAAV